MEKKFSSTAMSFTSLAFCFSGTLIPQSGMIRMSNCLKSKEYKILVPLRGVRGMKSKNSHRRRKAKRISYIYDKLLSFIDKREKYFKSAAVKHKLILVIIMDNFVRG